MLYPVLQDPLRPVVGSLFDRPVGVNIRQMLFGAGEQGGWYDVADMSTLFQDAAGTTPVTAVEQPVGRILDKSGRGNHATQATTTKRPVLKIDAGGCYYLSFDGVDDALQTGNIDFTGTDKMTVWAGVTKLSDVGLQMITEMGSANGSFWLLGGDNSTGAPGWGGRAGGTTRPLMRGVDSAAPIDSVLTLASDISGSVSSLRSNGALKATATSPHGTGSFTSAPLVIGGRIGSSLSLNGRLYSLIVRGAQSSLSQIEATEAYIKQKMRLP